MSAAKETPSTASSSSVSGSQDDATQVTNSASAMHMLGYMYEKNDAIFGSITVRQLIKDPYCGRGPL